MSQITVRLLAVCVGHGLICYIVTTLHDVRLELAKEDAREAESGIEAPHKLSMTTFLVKGLELEEQQ